MRSKKVLSYLGAGLVILLASVMVIYFAYVRITRDNEQQQNLVQIGVDLVNIQRQISQLKEDKQEIYQALASCNFLRETENLPIWEIDMDYIKAASSYTKAEAQVKKTLEKYKED